MSTTIFRSVLVDELTPEEYRRLKGLTMRQGGTMDDFLRTARYYCRQGQDHKSRVVLAERDGDVVGWALIYRGSSRPVAHFYVRARCRRQGVGTGLMREVRRYCRKPVVSAWDERSQAFFANFRGLEVDDHT